MPVTRIQIAPILIALGLAMVTLPLTVLSTMSIEGWSSFGDGWIHRLALDEALIVSFGAVVCGALVGGAVGGRRVRRQPLAGGLLALIVAWPAAIVGFIVLPAILGRPTSFGRICIDECSGLALGSLASIPVAIDRYAASLGFGAMISLIVWAPFLVVALVIASKPRSARVRIVGFGAAVIVFGLMNWMSVLTSGWSFFVLVGGVVVWTAILVRTARTSSEAVPLSSGLSAPNRSVRS
jgi:hypothetical protein